MKILILILLLFIPSCAFADIFSKSPDQASLNTALSNDAKNFYYRSGLDYNAYDVNEPPYRLERRGISLGSNRYDFHRSLKNLITRPEFNDLELEGMMQGLTGSRLLIWQYSSPSLADLYKHLDTIGHLRLGIRYRQFEDLEQAVDDPLIKLRKQSILDCIKRSAESGASEDDIESAFKSCFDSLSDPFGSLGDPSNGSFRLSNVVDMTSETLNRVNTGGEDINSLQELLPKISVGPDRIIVYGPHQKSRELITNYRKEFLEQLLQIVKEFKQGKEADPTVSSSLSVFGVPMTEGQVRNLALMDNITGYLAINKIASELAYLKTMDQFMKVSQLLDKAMIHPAVEPGYKILLKTSVEYVQKEIANLKEEKGRLGQYFGTMQTILDEADKQRLKTVASLNEEAVAQRQKGLFKLNP